MGLLDALGLTVLAQTPGKKPDAARTLQDKDFAADAKRRKLADEEARKIGGQRAKEAAQKPGKGPEPSALDKKIEKGVKDGADKAEKTARQLNKDAAPKFEVFEEISPEAEFAVDLENGIKSAKEQVEFIQKTIDYAQKFGDASGLKPLAEASKELKKITGGVLSGLGKAGKAASLGKEVVVFFQALDRFADASNDMSAGDGKSVEAWVGSLKRLWNASKPFVDRLKDEVFTAALAGSEAAGALGATLAIVGAELYIGIQALDAGVKVVNAYFERLHKLTKEDSDRVVQPPPAPQAPLPFRTRAETAASYKQHEADKKRQAEQREKNEAEAKRQMSLEQATEAFETTEFPKLYRQRWRKPIMDKVAEAWRKTRGTRDEVREWWDCFIDDRPVDDDTPPDSDAAEIPEPPPRKASASQGDAADEVRRFLDVAPPCPYFKAIYDGELKKYLATVQATKA